MQLKIISILVSLLVISRATAAETDQGSAAREIHFNRDIRPILSDNCFQCHGPDQNKRKAKLRLDTETGAFAERDPAILVRGKPSESELYRRITAENEDDRMPPPESGRQLSSEQIDLLKRWIEQGAQWEPHWSFIPPKPSPLPKVQDTAWPRNAVDFFILARLERDGLKPSLEAEKRVLLRRLSFDLTGLPPTAEEAREFLADTSDQAYERLVERLLNSPHYGERMAVHWLDLVRYADTDGFHADNYRSVYPYRDYVIQAFNRNLPFDQFTVEQLAGDLLPNATLSQKIASTYNRLNRTTEEGGSQAKEYLAKYAADRVRTASTIWMGATMGCAECHDHKFDPFTAKDFYSLAAFFADIKEVGVGKPEEIPLPNESQQAEIDRFNQQLARAQEHLDSVKQQLLAVQNDWENGLRSALEAGQLDWLSLKPIQFESKNGTKLMLQPDLSLLAGGENPDQETYSITLATDRSQITGLRLEALTHESLDKESLSRGGGNFVLTSFEVEAMPGQSIEWTKVPLASASADFSQRGFPAANAIDDKPQTGWAVDGNSKVENRVAAFVFAAPVAGGPGTVFRVHLKHESKFPRHNLGRFRLSLSTVPKPVFASHGLPDEAIHALRKPAAERDEKERAAIEKYYLDTAPEIDRAKNEIARQQKLKDDYVKQLPKSLVTVAVEPRTMRVLPRGNWMDDRGEVVRPAIPEFLAAQPVNGERLSRLDLAKWLVSAENPLAARTFVNRLWKIYFGTGLSRVLDDLGSQGEWPRHPELLDWLALEFMESGWNVKHMIKLMVTSSTYRQTSRPDPRLRERDPFNRLHARQSRFRLEAEAIRDNALAVSGLLSKAIGGPSVKPYQPDGYWQHLNFPKRTYQHDTGDAQYRRGLYSFWCRTFLHPSLMTLDAPGREECTATRVISNNPLQALVLLNDPTYVEAARFLAQRLIENCSGDFQQKLEWVFWQTLTRSPRSDEITTLSQLYSGELARFSKDREAAKQLTGVGEGPAPDVSHASELAAWTSVARTILNLHEAITRY